MRQIPHCVFRILLLCVHVVTMMTTGPLHRVPNPYSFSSLRPLIQRSQVTRSWRLDQVSSTKPVVLLGLGFCIRRTQWVCPFTALPCHPMPYHTTTQLHFQTQSTFPHHTPDYPARLKRKAARDGSLLSQVTQCRAAALAVCTHTETGGERGVGRRETLLFDTVSGAEREVEMVV